MSTSQGFLALLIAIVAKNLALVMAFEEEFGCEIPDDAAEKIVTVGDAVNFIKENS